MYKSIKQNTPHLFITYKYIAWFLSVLNTKHCMDNINVVNHEVRFHNHAITSVISNAYMPIKFIIFTLDRN